MTPFWPIMRLDVISTVEWIFFEYQIPCVFHWCNTYHFEGDMKNPYGLETGFGQK